MTGEGGNPFRFSGFEMHNEGIATNDGGSGSSQPKPSSLGKSKPSSGLTCYFPPGAAHGSQPTIKASLQSPKKWRQVDLCVA